MDKFATENLILLEFLVDQLNLDFEMQQELASITGNTCVSFQFLDNAPLLVCEQDFCNNKMENNNSVKSGKSCLFSLTPQQAEEVSKTFDITVEVFKKMKPGVLPEKIPIGASLISITNLFNQLVESIATAGESPAAKALKDCFKISNGNGEVVGHLSVYIRMSCFGKLIVTQFQMNLEDKSVQFKAKEGHYLFKYNKGKGDAPRDDTCPAMAQWQRRQQQQQQLSAQNVDCPKVPCANFLMEQKPQNSQVCPLQPCMFHPAAASSRAPCGPLQQVTESEMTPCGLPTQYRHQMMETPCVECSAPPPTPSASGAYQEIGAQMGGNALTIRVHKDKKVEECRGDDDGTTTTTTITDDGACCRCTMDNFGKKNRPARPQNVCCMPCPPNAQQQLAMRPGVPDPNVPFSFTMGGCGNAANNNVIVNPPTCTAKDGTCFTEISDPNKDVFILRIGKKCEGTDKKNNLELELCTPKGPEMKPAPKKESRDTQVEEGDVGPEDTGGKGKGEKGKGGGKGKGSKGKGSKGKGSKGKGSKGKGKKDKDGKKKKKLGSDESGADSSDQREDTENGGKGSDGKNTGKGNGSRPGGAGAGGGEGGSKPGGGAGSRPGGAGGSKGSKPPQRPGTAGGNGGSRGSISTSKRPWTSGGKIPNTPQGSRPGGRPPRTDQSSGSGGKGKQKPGRKELDPVKDQHRVPDGYVIVC